MLDIPTRAIRTRGSLDRTPSITDSGEPISVSSPPSNTATTAKEIRQAYADAAEQRLTSFVEAEIAKMRSAIHLGSGHEPTFYEVNEALCSYQDTNLAILALYNTTKVENVKAKETFDDWFAGRYIEIRDRVNPRNLSAQKWYSQKEIEMMVRHEYVDEFNKYNWDLVVTEQQLSFLRRMLESWSSHQYVLTQLSKNLIAEMNGLGVDDALNRAAESTNMK
jgi:hypothetical protein